MAIKTIIVLLIGLTLASVRLAEAQQAGRIYRIGFLYAGFPGLSPGMRLLQRELRALGYIESKNIAFEYRFAENKIERLPALADELVRLKVDVLTTTQMSAALAAKNATMSDNSCITRLDNFSFVTRRDYCITSEMSISAS